MLSTGALMLVMSGTKLAGLFVMDLLGEVVEVLEVVEAVEGADGRDTGSFVLEERTEKLK